jgi:molybdate transport system substrate-binding protein
MPRKLAAATLAALVGLGLAVSGCSSTTSSTGTATVTGTITVYAAASMQPTFDALKTTFESQYPGTTVVFNYAGSQTLATQLTEGASADVFVSANDAQMKVVTDAGLGSGDSKVFATNQLTIAVPPDNPAKISSFQDLTKSGLKLVICQDTVPCGAATVKLETATGVTLKPVSQEKAVTDVMAKVRTGEADAGLVYKTDVIAAGSAVKGIDFSESSKAINRNSIVLLKNAPNSAGGQAWIDLVTSAAGKKVFTDAGFGAAE